MSYKGKYRVLIVDDNKEFQKALGQRLKSIIDDRVEVIDTALNGCEAIEMFRIMVYDIIFMDVEMPIMDGIMTTKYLRRRFPDARIIAMSFNNDLAFMKEMIQAGSNTYISKTDIKESDIREIFNA